MCRVMLSQIDLSGSSSMSSSSPMTNNNEKKIDNTIQITSCEVGEKIDIDSSDENIVLAEYVVIQNNNKNNPGTNKVSILDIHITFSNVNLFRYLFITFLE